MCCCCLVSYSCLLTYRLCLTPHICVTAAATAHCGSTAAPTSSCSRGCCPAWGSGGKGGRWGEGGEGGTVCKVPVAVCHPFGLVEERKKSCHSFEIETVTDRYSGYSGICSVLQRRRKTSFSKQRQRTGVSSSGELACLPCRQRILHQISNASSQNSAAETALASIPDCQRRISPNSSMQVLRQRPATGLQQQQMHSRPLLKAGRPARRAGAVMRL